MNVRDAMARANVRRQSDITKSNLRIAVKLFTQRPTYELIKSEKDNQSHVELKSRVSRMAR